MPAAGRGLSATQMLGKGLPAYITLGMEPEHDCWDGAAAERALAGAELTVALSPWCSDRMKAWADVILPVATFGETAGSYVNAHGDWQTFAGVGRPVGRRGPPGGCCGCWVISSSWTATTIRRRTRSMPSCASAPMTRCRIPLPGRVTSATGWNSTGWCVPAVSRSMAPMPWCAGAMRSSTPYRHGRRARSWPRRRGPPKVWRTVIRSACRWARVSRGG
ncbi:MAG: molybdopterin-dependent oxidoreductase [Arhodomonas sp.]|nr:molybdopterin-dependent oxidoreductase [Arhodomonas sp.]